MSDERRALPARILFQDGYVAVVYKKIGEVCERSPENPALSLIENLRSDLESVAARALPDLEAVHRIDQPVSGCVLLALDRQTLASLSAEFASGAIRKKYRAIVERPSSGTVSRGGRLEHMVRFDQKHHKATAVAKEEIRSPGPEWKSAALSWTLVGVGDRYLFLEVSPETGRTHQIRAQLAAFGLPIKGDLKYGARRSDPLGGIRLHAYAIQFRHPVTGDAITVSAPVMDPDALWQAFERAAD